MSNRTQILAVVHQALEDDPEVDEFLLDLSDHALSRMVFHQPVGNENNIRLSERGVHMLSQSFESHCIEFPENYRVKARDLLRMAEASTQPYYIGKDSVVLFDKEMAARLKLFGGDLSLIF